ncbi:MAG: abortive infection family protein [Clostridiales bacterium]|jgi:hypothetical protein|nr:abortive infection family protein [Clostridiales bacterium]
MENKSKFELLKDREILNILNGDKDFSQEEGKIRIAMPYLKGCDICKISTHFGDPKSYNWSGGNESRWKLMEALIDYAIKNNKINDVLLYIFSKERFCNIWENMSPQDIEEVYKKTIDIVFEKINGRLYFGGNKLVFIDKIFYIKKINAEIKIEAPIIKQVDTEYIKGLVERANKDILEKSYDSALTKARTMIEEAFCYVIEQNGDEANDKGDIGKLYGQVKTILDMHQGKELDKKINELLSGLEKILKAISEMRNVSSDSHGYGNKRLNIDEHHARLFVNSAMVFADFILAVHKRKCSEK